MSRTRFEDILSAMRWSNQPEAQPEGMTSKAYRWMLVDDFVNNFNKHRANNFHPSGDVCADESMIRWYGLGGAFVQLGLPMYVAMERKPDNGAEIQNVACVESNIMMQLKYVDAEEEEAAKEKEHNGDEYDGLNHGKYISRMSFHMCISHIVSFCLYTLGTKVLLQLLKPWDNTDRNAIADSYFASVSTGVQLKKHGWTFLGNVKTATKEFPMEYLGKQILAARGARVVLASINEETGETELVAVTWLDRNRRCFIATVCGYGEGEEIMRKRYRQLDDAADAHPDLVMITVKQPKAVEGYYEGAGVIDGMNRTRAAELRLDRNFGTKDWSKRFNLGIWGMIVCDAFALFQQVVAGPNRASCPREFFCKLADELINNKEGVRATRSQAARKDDEAAEKNPTLRSTLRFKTGGKRHDQGKCKIKGCTSQSTLVCDACTHGTDKTQPQTWICNPFGTTPKDCWKKHMKEVHGIDIH